MSDRARLSRVLAEGDSLVFDNGRIVVRHEFRNGRSARMVVEMAADVVLAPPQRRETPADRATLSIPPARMRAIKTR